MNELPRVYTPAGAVALVCVRASETGPNLRDFRMRHTNDMRKVAFDSSLVNRFFVKITPVMVTLGAGPQIPIGAHLISAPGTFTGSFRQRWETTNPNAHRCDLPLLLRKNGHPFSPHFIPCQTQNHSPIPNSGEKCRLVIQRRDVREKVCLHRAKVMRQHAMPPRRDRARDLPVLQHVIPA